MEFGVVEVAGKEVASAKLGGAEIGYLLRYD